MTYPKHERSNEAEHRRGEAKKRRKTGRPKVVNQLGEKFTSEPRSESVGRRNSRTTFLRSDWPRPFARREMGVEMELGRSENNRPEQRRS
ncbi:hypothetical protein TNCV_2190091 [Trichonephila clavipes]|uniref:Uncharacterized protein n=1 Tax=Trichonephila clavipes TaxID=2585209 RepID=A0A8X6RDS2_TRICX|nr:hypothetical protein TNCV_2190091 [Trichonephila clavipes]